MKLILDFDDVLFDAKGLKQVLYDILREGGIDNGEELYEVERKSGRAFIPKEFLKKACLVTGNEETSSVDVDMMYEKLMRACVGLINHELVTLVQAVGKENCFIVSNGNQEFQEDKVNQSGFGQLVEKVIIVPGTKSMEIEKICKEFLNEEIFFIDDKSIYFNDINYEGCKNLTTILYTGKESIPEIEKEIGRVKTIENQRALPGGPVMK